MTSSGKGMDRFDLNKKLNVATENGFLFNQINKLTMKFYSHLRFINISFNPKFRILNCHRQFFGVIFQN